MNDQKPTKDEVHDYVSQAREKLAEAAREAAGVIPPDEQEERSA